MVAAYGGFPNRYPHWRFGMEYEQLSKGYEYGLSKIYEMVINNNPSDAYLLESNRDVDQKLVMAHVWGHVDLCKTKFAFQHANRKMRDERANHATRIRRIIDKVGIEPVETFIDRCLSLENLINQHAPHFPAKSRDEAPDRPIEVRGFKTDREYMSHFINPQAFLDEQRKKLEEERAQKKKFPEKPERDVLAFLIEHAPLERWEADVLAVIREEAYYFAPQGQTKIANEGWACLAQASRIFTENGLVTIGDVIEGEASKVSDGDKPRAIYDRHVIRDHATISIRTRRGLMLTGSNNHRIVAADGSWKRLDEVSVGTDIRIAGGAGLWPEQAVQLGWRPDPRIRVIVGRSDEEAVAPRLLTQRNVALQAGPELYALGSAHVRKLAHGRRKAVRLPAFLRAYFDCDGYAGKGGIILRTSSETMSEQVQLLLLNFGILSRRRPQKDECWRLGILGASAAKFAQEIGFGLERKQRALDEYVSKRKWFKEEKWEDEIVEITHGRADVYDISVEETHRYAACGFINHNSYWHSTIMTTRALKDSEIVDYADHHSGTMGTRPGAVNPYKLGIELWRHIEDRWNKGRFGKEWDECDDLRARRAWDKKLGLGRQKIFEVRKHYNDVTFIDEFLTADFASEQKLFVYGFNEKGNRWEILDREFQKVKRKLLQQLTNFGQPIIEVVEGNFENRGELLLAHRHDGVDLRVDYAKDTLVNLQAMWRRPVAIVTRVDGKGVLMRFDGRDHADRKVDY